MSSSPVPTPRWSLYEDVDDDTDIQVASGYALEQDSSLEETAREPARDCRELFDEVCGDDHDDGEPELQVKKPAKTYQKKGLGLLNLREAAGRQMLSVDEDDNADDSHDDDDDYHDDLQQSEDEHDENDEDYDCDSTVKRRQPKRTAKKGLAKATAAAVSKTKQAKSTKTKAAKAASKPAGTKARAKRTRKPKEKVSLVDAVHKAYLEAIANGKLPDFSTFDNEELCVDYEPSPQSAQSQSSPPSSPPPPSPPPPSPPPTKTAVKRKTNWNFNRDSITATSTPFSDITNSRNGNGRNGSRGGRIRSRRLL